MYLSTPELGPKGLAIQVYALSCSVMFSFKVAECDESYSEPSNFYCALGREIGHLKYSSSVAGRSGHQL